MEITVTLLGSLNEAIGPNKSLRHKYVAKVTAGKLAQYLQYDKKGKKHPFKIKLQSIIRIDSEVQRGFDEETGCVFQEAEKANEIADILLGKNEQYDHAFLGTLVWNVRSTANGFSVFKREPLTPGSIPSYELSFECDAIYLTDSAHRHFGIVEAFTRYNASPGNYPRFDPRFEFPVEIYNVDKHGEKELFFELNSKQKRITAAKQKQMDVTSPIGILRDAIQRVDENDGKLFLHNIEVASNKNDNHTLMTMSVFVSSIGEMFPAEEIRAAKEDDELQSEMVDYYCKFFYALRDNLRIKCDIPFPPAPAGQGKTLELSPFYNLYTQFIEPVLDAVPEDPESPAVESLLEGARERARSLNQMVREQDIANSNAVTKALCRVGRTIRRMPRWQAVIERLQSDLVAGCDGRFFQKANPELLVAPENDVAVATLNEDGITLNVQVQTKTIKRIATYLLEKLGLIRKATLAFVSSPTVSINLAEDEVKHTVSVSKTTGAEFVVELPFEVAAGVQPARDDLRLSLKPLAPWKGGTFSGSKRLTAFELVRDESFDDPHYGSDVHRYVAKYVARLPAYESGDEGFRFELTATHPGFNGDNTQTEALLGAQVAP
jgi:hypothetical protein